LRQHGLGSKRLLSIAINRSITNDGCILLIDEIEYGLEPHRLRHLIRTLRKSNKVSGQVLFTTHSPFSIQECTPHETFVVRNDKGRITVTSLELSDRKLSLHNSEAMLGRRILLCEGETELGMCHAFDIHWSNIDHVSFSVYDVAVSSGEGSTAATYAEKFARLGYSVCLFRDSDTSLKNPSSLELTSLGVKIIEWSGSKCTEERIVEDLELPEFRELVLKTVEKHKNGLHAFLDSISTKLSGNSNLAKLKTADISDWIISGYTEKAIREAFIVFARGDKVYKTSDEGEWLGNFIIEREHTLSKTSDLKKVITELKAWAHA
jgi:putative ATP-dependent endonuclease of OLD family